MSGPLIVRPCSTRQHRRGGGRHAVGRGLRDYIRAYRLELSLWFLAIGSVVFVVCNLS